MIGAAPAGITWVIGAGGLLGTSLTNTLLARSGIVLTSSIAWTTRQAQPDLADGIDRFRRLTREHQLPWRIAWCAGAGVTGTSDQLLAQELELLSAFLGDLAGQPDLGHGTVFLASSAGGLYAGGHKNAAYDEHDEPQPISAYGRAKLQAECLTTAFGTLTGNTVLIGRIANLYGPGQNLSKGQGLISHLCRANLTRQPISVYVSLDTIRDYLYVDDCADLIADMLDRASGSAPATVREGEAPLVLKVLASQHGTTIAALLAVCRQVFRRAPRLVLGSSPNARFQVKDLRLRSVVWPELDRRSLTPLPVGIAATAAGLLRTAQLPAA